MELFSRIKFAEKQRTIQQIQTIYNKKKNRRGTDVSILNVEHLSHGFGDRAIFQDVSFRLLKGARPRTPQKIKKAGFGPQNLAKSR